MAKKHVDEYYNQITNQYHEMLQDIKDFEQDCAKGLVEPERVERLKEQIAPIKQNWERWTFMMFLLNKPTRESKVPRYRQQNKKLIARLDKKNTVNATIHENEEARKMIGK